MNKRPCRLAFAALAAVAVSALLAGIAIAKHENPANFDFIEEDGWGDWSGVMTGRIIDQEGNPLPFAHIKVYFKDIETTADENGFFTIRGLQQGGHYSLIVDHTGCEPAVARWIPIPRYRSADIGDFHLDPELVNTNFLQVTSNLVGDVWVSVTNVVDIVDGVTNIAAFSRALEPAQSALDAFAAALGSNALPLIEERPAATNAPLIEEHPAATNAALIEEHPAATNAPLIEEHPATTNAAPRGSDASP